MQESACLNGCLTHTSKKLFKLPFTTPSPPFCQFYYWFMYKSMGVRAWELEPLIMSSNQFQFQNTYSFKYILYLTKLLYKHVTNINNVTKGYFNLLNFLFIKQSQKSIKIFTKNVKQYNCFQHFIKNIIIIKKDFDIFYFEH